MPEEKPKRNRGGGRPRLTDPSESKARKIHQVRAHDDEWPIIKAFIDCTRLNGDLCKQAVLKLRTDIESTQRQLDQEAEKRKRPPTNEKNEKIKELRLKGYSQTDIAKLMGVSQAHISRVLNPNRTGEVTISQETQEKIKEVKDLSSIGMTQVEIADKLGISQSRVSKLMNMS